MPSISLPGGGEEKCQYVSSKSIREVDIGMRAETHPRRSGRSTLNLPTPSLKTSPTSPPPPPSRPLRPLTSPFTHLPSFSYAKSNVSDVCRMIASPA